MRMRKIKYGEREVEYDADAPCISCGEPVLAASVGGTVICPSCDLGKCRYCGISIFAVRESIDGGASKTRILAHMKWHHLHNPEEVIKRNEGTVRIMDIFEQRRIEDAKPKI